MSDKPARAVLIGPFSGPVQGVCVIATKLADRMTARGLGVACIDLSPGRFGPGPAYHATRAARTLWGALRLVGVGLRGRQRAIMHVDGGGGLLYNIVLALVLRLTGQPLLLYHHSTRYVLADSLLMRILLKVAGPLVPHVFCSEKMAGLFCARYRTAGAVLIVNNAAWVDASETGPGSPGRLRLGFLSALSLEKGLGRAIGTLRLARQRGLDAELALAGAVADPDGAQLLRQAQAEFGPALILCGVVRGGDKTRFYGDLDVFLFPSLYPHETQSLVVPEALAAGTPVIAFDHRFVGEILGQAGGLLVCADASFPEQAVDWIGAGQDLWAARRKAARQQFEAERAQARGQVEQLIAWAGGAGD